ncbi:MAG: uroporphyrinogen decarboxylase family protein [Prolixibacteraceae bacterium]|jgi:uroporphyrinogen-III decarboxylase|nr:uroporphyrinogen decarboxylase family protein [Prolixibacteraceae bacterium]
MSHPDYTDYTDRFSMSAALIKMAYEHRNKGFLPFIVNHMNYWIDGEDPDLIPDDYFSNPASMTGFQLRKINQHLQLFNDNYIPFLMPWYGTGVVPSAVGCQVQFPPKGDPALKNAIINDPAQIKGLKKPDPYNDGLMPRVLQTIDYMKNATSLPVGVTDVQGPLNIALSLCGVENLFLWMYLHPDEVHEIMEYSTEVLIDWIRVQKEHAGQENNSGAWPHGILLPEGFGGIWISDDDCTQLPADLYREFVVPYNSMVLKAFGGGTIHFCGSARHQLQNFLETEGLTGINNFCMGDFAQVKEMQELFKNKITLMLCDFAPFDPEKYFNQLFSFLKPEGIILSSYVVPCYALHEGRYVRDKRDTIEVSKRIYDIIVRYRVETL